MEQDMNRNTNMNQQEQTDAYFARELQRRAFCTIIKIGWEIGKTLK